MRREFSDLPMLARKFLSKLFTDGWRRKNICPNDNQKARDVFSLLVRSEFREAAILANQNSYCASVWNFCIEELRNETS